VIFAISAEVSASRRPAAPSAEGGRRDNQRQCIRAGSATASVNQRVATQAFTVHSLHIGRRAKRNAFRESDPAINSQGSFVSRDYAEALRWYRAIENGRIVPATLTVTITDGRGGKTDVQWKL